MRILGGRTPRTPPLNPPLGSMKKEKGRHLFWHPILKSIFWSIFPMETILYNYWLWNRLLSGFINLKKCNIHWATSIVVTLRIHSCCNILGFLGDEILAWSVTIDATDGVQFSAIWNKCIKYYFFVFINKDAIGIISRCWWRHESRTH